MKCPECGSKQIISDPSESICGDCGLVLEDQLLFSGALRV